MRIIKLFLLLGFISVSFTQNYAFKSVVLDEGGKMIASSNYISRLSIGQQIASSISNSNYKVILGFWHLPYGGPQSGIEENDIQKWSFSPFEFKLSQNFPNPFRNQTTIKYSLPIKTDINLKVFDNTGRIVRTLFSGKQKPGVYIVTWNLNGVLKSQLSNGVYFYRLEAGNYTATKKMILTK